MYTKEERKKCAACGHPRYRHGKNTLDCKVKLAQWEWCPCHEYSKRRKVDGAARRGGVTGGNMERTEPGPITRMRRRLSARDLAIYHMEYYRSHKLEIRKKRAATREAME